MANMKVISCASRPRHRIALSRARFLIITFASQTASIRSTSKTNSSVYAIKKRYMHLTEDLLKQNPNIAGQQAIAEWGQPKSNITHLIFCTISVDYVLSNLLGLRPSGGASALRLAKDMAENNADARVLIVCCEITAMLFRGPDEAHIGDLVGQALFDRRGWRAASLSDCFRGSNDNPRKRGEDLGLLVDIGEILKEAFGPFGISDWNKIFWIAHPGGPVIFNRMEMGLGLGPDKMRCSRHVLTEYGNVSSPSVLFVLDAMRKFSTEEGRSTTGEGLDWGVMFWFGPGLTVESLVLRSMPIG